MELSDDNGCFIATINSDGGWFSIYNVTSSNPKAATAMMSKEMRPHLSQHKADWQTKARTIAQHHDQGHHM